jgi:hypothetical protein
MGKTIKSFSVYKSEPDPVSSKTTSLTERKKLTTLATDVVNEGGRLQL